MDEAVAAMSEPGNTAIVLTALGILIGISALLSRTVDRMGVPIFLLFLVLGMLGGSEGIGGVAFEDYELAVRVGTIALVLILFDGGLNTAASAVRQVLAPASVLATVGVVATAALLSGFARLMGLSWPEALLLGAVVSSTDAAAVFAVLRGGRLNLEPQLARTLEVESCANDPMAVILTMGLIEALSGSQGSGWSLAMSVPVQLVVGIAVGLGVGYVSRFLMGKARLTTVGLYPALTLAAAFVSFGVATLAWGSGFMAVFTTGVVLGNGQLPYRNGLARVHDAIAWLSQITVFLMLGLLVFPSKLLEDMWLGLGLGLFLAVGARPLAVWLCLLPFGYPAKKVGYVGWIGLRGAVPIVLGTFPVLADVPGAQRIFNLVFFIVVVSSFIPGSTIRWVTRRLGLTVAEQPAPAAVLEVNAMHALNGELTSFHISPEVAVCGAKLSELALPAGVSVVMIVRGTQMVAAQGSTVLGEGDHAYVFYQREHRGLVELLFGRPEDGG